MTGRKINKTKTPFKNKQKQLYKLKTKCHNSMLMIQKIMFQYECDFDGFILKLEIVGIVDMMMMMV